MASLSLENPPVRYPIRFKGVTVGEDGMIAEEDLLALLDEAAGALDILLEQYTAEEEKAA